MEPTSSETITGDDQDTLPIPVPTLKGDMTTHSYDPACSDIVILESEEHEEKEADQGEEEEEEEATREIEAEQFFSMGKPVEPHPLSVSEPVPMPRMALGTASQVEQILAAPSPPFALSPAVTKENLSKSSGAAITTLTQPAPPTIDIPSKSTMDKGVQMGPLNLSEELESPEGPPSKMERRDVAGKSPSGTSPSMEEYASEGFTTADFYIDESMPSSMTESNTRRVTELQQVIQEKSSLLEVRERELEEQRRAVDELKPKLQKAKESFKMLQDVAEKGTLQLKCELLSLEKQTSKNKDEFQLYMASVTSKLLETITSFEKSQSEQWQNTIDNLKADYDAQQIDWEEKLDLEVQKLHDTQSQLELYDKKLRDKEEEVEQVRTDLTNQMKDLKSKADEEMTQAKSQLCLEHELELEKVQSELTTELESKGSELIRLEEVVEENKETISRLEQELNVLNERLKADFEIEKKALIEKMELQCQEMCKGAEDKCREELMKELDTKMHELNLEHKDKLKHECDNVTKTLQKVHEEEVKKNRTILNEEFEVKLKVVQEQLTLERQEQLGKLSAANAELESQINELQGIKAKLEKENDEVSELYQSEKEQILKDHEEAIQDTISLEKHQDLVDEMKATFDTEKQDEIAQVNIFFVLRSLLKRHVHINQLHCSEDKFIYLISFYYGHKTAHLNSINVL